MALGPIGQISLAVSDTDRAEAFYGDRLGLRKLYRYGDIAFFDCAGVRLMLAPPEHGEKVVVAQGALYFRVADLVRTVAALAAAGIGVEQAPHLVAPMPDHDLWMSFIRDPDGHLLGLMMEAPKGYAPPA